VIRTLRRVIRDVIGGLNLVIGVLAALRHRDKTGVGQMIDISLTDGCVLAAASMFRYIWQLARCQPRTATVIPPPRLAAVITPRMATV
jgi:crotonobetainyl-CoA:carnitine CoA-transferase CaiB-like acyl-CoA transferase